MKKVWIILAAVLLIVAIVGGIMWFNFSNSPEYALMNIFKDMNENGAEGLRPHLTAEAQTTLDNINAFADNKIVNAIVGLLDMKDDITVLKEKLQQTKWDVVDIMKGENNAVAILSFEYDEDLSGTMEISMTKEEKVWKIDDIQLPKLN
ncbi:MAG: hypothetical protein IJN37_10635 [Clostridia bacterium]|nr:hypothetical protein [Clostridia bacterium]